MPRVKGPGKDGAALQNHPKLKDRYERQGMVEPIPDSAKEDPVKWADEHLATLAPDAAKEVEWALKFGSDSMRYVAARDVLATKGITTKPKEQGVVQQAMVFNFQGPVSPSGAPILPFSNAAPTPTLDAPAAPVIVPEAPSDPKEPK